jgi:hypothetical protein
MKTEVTPCLYVFFQEREREYRIKWNIVAIESIRGMEIIIKKPREVTKSLFLLLAKMPRAAIPSGRHQKGSYLD